MRSAVVVGAGVGGLATAGALARTGWRVTLLERADRLRADPAALLLWPNAVAALRSLGLGAGLTAIGTRVPMGGLRRADGQWLAQPSPTASLAAPVVVHAEDLHDTFIAGLGDQIEIRTGITVRSMHARPGDRPAVGDGRHTWEADVIIAADGADSTLRARLAPQSIAVSSGYAAWRAVIPWYRAPKLPDDLVLAGETLSGGYRFLAASLGDRGSSGASSRGGIYWTATVAGAARPESKATQLTLLKRWFAGWHAPIGDLLAATEPDDLVQQDGRQLRPLPNELAFPVGTGGFALVGDAAHAMPHHLAQGAGLALEDAATLRSLLLPAIPGPACNAALAAYSAARRARAAQVVRQTQRVGAVLAPRGNLVTRARDRAFGALAPRVLDRAATVAADWQPPAA
ncbi:FAD-dependent oxidoreductase [Catellatospora citrea]|uniref:Salicylate hydroxylase n=1 Tax=Catellatospora citrea TaxID=53366 RepID=A0A8J3NWU8_9ACTN|nr:NAD(P)/FAD-dependent oxidoreductase [Catellatospora citrea]RKE07034.1 2-polyprenyl-6-methoxyphenol hydroxylase-like FAD-dependent oxidoreductase [Catellatospora citrea]GIF95186.1 salicylate hydroxylase [Catellatospora citrea]